jgi:isoamylase
MPIARTIDLTWFDWNLDGRQVKLMEFTQKLIAIRRAHPNLHRRKFYQDRSIRGTVEKDIVWLRPDGQEMSDDEWGLGWVRSLGLRLNGETLGEVDEGGEPVKDDTFLFTQHRSTSATLHACAMQPRGV